MPSVNLTGNSGGKDLQNAYEAMDLTGRLKFLSQINPSSASPSASNYSMQGARPGVVTQPFSAVNYSAGYSNMGPGSPIYRIFEKIDRDIQAGTLEARTFRAVMSNAPRSVSAGQGAITGLYAQGGSVPGGFGGPMSFNAYRAGYAAGGGGVPPGFRWGGGGNAGGGAPPGGFTFRGYTGGGGYGGGGGGYGGGGGGMPPGGGGGYGGGMGRAAAFMGGGNSRLWAALLENPLPAIFATVNAYRSTLVGPEEYSFRAKQYEQAQAFGGAGAAIGALGGFLLGGPGGAIVGGSLGALGGAGVGALNGISAERRLASQRLSDETSSAASMMDPYAKFTQGAYAVARARGGYGGVDVMRMLGGMRNEQGLLQSAPFLNELLLSTPGALNLLQQFGMPASTMSGNRNTIAGLRQAQFLPGFSMVPEGDVTALGRSLGGMGVLGRFGNYQTGDSRSSVPEALLQVGGILQASAVRNQDTMQVLKSIERATNDLASNRYGGSATGTLGFMDQMLGGTSPAARTGALGLSAQSGMQGSLGGAFSSNYGAYTMTRAYEMAGSQTGLARLLGGGDSAKGQQLLDSMDPDQKNLVQEYLQLRKNPNDRAAALVRLQQLMMGSGNTGWAYINQEVAKELGVSPLAAKVIGQSAAGLTGLEGNTLDAGRTSMPGSMPGRTSFPGSGDARLASIRDRLMKDLGLTRNQAAGILSNLYGESGVKGIPQRYGLRPGDKPDFGWAQWHGTRQDAFRKWAAAKGLDPASDDANYQYLVEDLKTNPYWQSTMNNLRKQGGATASANAFYDYEKGLGSSPAMEALRGMHLTQAERIAGLQSAPGSGVGGEGVDSSVPGGAILPSVDAQNQALAASSNAMSEFTGSLKGASAAVDAFAKSLNTALGDRYNPGGTPPSMPGIIRRAPSPPNQSTMPPGTN